MESGRLGPFKAIDLDCGEGDNVVYLAQQGFDVTGIDISPLGISKARRKAKAVGVSPYFIVGDITDLKEVEGLFDLVMDNRCLHSLFLNIAREGYVQTVLRITRPGSHLAHLQDVPSSRACGHHRGVQRGFPEVAIIAKGTLKQRESLACICG